MISTARAHRLTVVVSRGQSRAPDKRGLENELIDRVGGLDGARVVSIPHLYDCPPNGETMKELREIEGDLVFLSWVFPRAARWVLDRNGISGQEGEVLLTDSDDSDEDQEAGNEDALENPLVDRVIDAREIPNRSVYCIDLRVATDADSYLEEIQRISRGNEGELQLSVQDNLHPPESIEPLKIEEGTQRRWYPVIDYSRCTNCMECIDFCLFGVYGVDGIETILVEQPDNCRKGCPACSRVCPENAIIFPQHKTPAIAGANTDDGTGLKIDLSLLFGAPENNEDPIAAAARERDEQLLLAGRAAVGLDVGIPKRHADKDDVPKDELDYLIDELDDYEL